MLTANRSIMLLLAGLLGLAATPIAVAEDAAAIADALHTALATGDEAVVRRLLDESVLIYESGGVEASLEEYAGHHMPADMAFTGAIEREVLQRQVFESGEQAVVSTRSRLNGTYRDKPIDLDATETLVLSRTGGEWRIVHVHWSSRNRKDEQ